MSTATQVRERPILFRGEMVRAILKGRKTQTRRVVKPRPQAKRVHRRILMHSCPYGVGDRLWVRETLCSHNHYGMPLGLIPQVDPLGLQRWSYAADGVAEDTVTHRYPSIFMPRWASRITLEITDARAERLRELIPQEAMDEGLSVLSKDGGRTWKFGIPDRDGEPGNDDTGWHWADWRISPVAAYAHLWDLINGSTPGCSWAENPWVWAITFQLAEVSP